MALPRLTVLLASLRARGLTAAGLFCLVAGMAWAQVRDAAPVSASSVKAAFLYKFAGYVEWPESAAGAGGPITIGVAGAEPFAAELAEITRGRTVGGRPINVRRVADEDSFDGLQILFIANQARGNARGLLASARSRPILTVTESAGALADGSIINFTQDKDRVRVEISLYAAEQSMLKLNSRLLAVADSVHRGPE
jgi:hypothetical protein